MNTIERVRIKVGLTKPQILHVLESKPGRVTLFTARDEAIDPIFLYRVSELERQYDLWREEVKDKLKAAAYSSRDGYLRTREVARILGISDFHLSQMRIRGQVDAVQEGTRRFKYTLAQILDLVDSNSTVLGTEVRKNRGPLTNGFLAWRAENPVELRATA
jgi:hypothetical protein